MIYRVKQKQVSYGEAIGIILLENFAPFIPGDVANATTYGFPVRFQRVKDFSVERIFKHDMTLLDAVLKAGKALVREGVRAVTGDCGFMVIYQDELAAELGVPVFMSSLLQIPFLARTIAACEKVGIVTADSRVLDDLVLRKAGVEDTGRLCIGGMENQEHFTGAIIEERGLLDSELLEAEVVGVARELAAANPALRVVLLECSVLPPYGAAIQEALGLPVFDFVTMINYMFSGLVKTRFQGFM
jgi:hypothetical protein